MDLTGLVYPVRFGGFLRVQHGNAAAITAMKEDFFYRVDHLDRQEDRDVMEPTNLLESCDRMFDFGQKHLNDLFVLDGIRSGSAGDARTGAQFSRWKSSLGR